MGCDTYSVYDGTECIAKEMSLEIALVLIRACLEYFYEDNLSLSIKKDGEIGDVDQQ